MIPRDLPIGVLISGAGTSLQNLIDRIADGRLPGVQIRVVISSRAEVEGVARARRAGLPVEIVRARDHATIEEFSQRITQILEQTAVSLAVMAGWLCLWQLPARWLGRVINIHPALLPEFGGKGFYGRHVHAAVLAAGRNVSGATVHYVDNQYDHGPIINQRQCPVSADDTPDSLAQRVGEIEREILPQVIAMFRDNTAPAFRA